MVNSNFTKIKGYENIAHILVEYIKIYAPNIGDMAETVYCTSKKDLIGRTVVFDSRSDYYLIENVIYDKEFIKAVITKGAVFVFPTQQVGIKDLKTMRVDSIKLVSRKFEILDIYLNTDVSGIDFLHSRVLYCGVEYPIKNFEIKNLDGNNYLKAVDIEGGKLILSESPVSEYANEQRIEGLSPLTDEVDPDKIDASVGLKSIKIRIAVSLYEDLELLAELEGMPKIDGLVRQALEEFTKNQMRIKLKQIALDKKE